MSTASGVAGDDDLEYAVVDEADMRVESKRGASRGHASVAMSASMTAHRLVGADG